MINRLERFTIKQNQKDVERYLRLLKARSLGGVISIVKCYSRNFQWDCLLWRGELRLNELWLNELWLTKTGLFQKIWLNHDWPKIKTDLLKLTEFNLSKDKLASFVKKSYFKYVNDLTKPPSIRSLITLQFRSCDQTTVELSLFGWSWILKRLAKDFCRILVCSFFGLLILIVLCF